ncbi:MAG: EamA family transporter, partial [Acidimicrobiia bacterium]|nr:EamA family transporter [Acidimicrobiia bacterium]
VVLGGIVLVIGAAVYLNGDLGFTAVGTAAAMVALAGNSAATLLGRAVNRGHEHPSVVVTAMSMAVGAATLAGVALGTERPWPRLTWGVARVIAWMALVNTAVAFTLWSWVLRHLAAVEASVINNLMLAEIALLGWLFLGERPGLVDALGIGIVLSGTAMAQLTSARQAPPSGTSTAGARAS